MRDYYPEYIKSTYNSTTTKSKQPSSIVGKDSEHFSKEDM